MAKVNRPALMTKEELRSFRESRRIVQKRIQEANSLLKVDPAAAMRRLDEARLLTTQLKVIARTYLRRLRGR
jgi:hypothetical protein